LPQGEQHCGERPDTDVGAGPLIWNDLSSGREVEVMGGFAAKHKWTAAGAAVVDG
jgi:hypothetical protein